MSSLARITSLLNSGSTDHNLLADLQSIKQQLSDLEDFLAAGAQVRSRVQRLNDGERPSSFFSGPNTVTKKLRSFLQPAVPTELSSLRLLKSLMFIVIFTLLFIHLMIPLTVFSLFFLIRYALLFPRQVWSLSTSVYLFRNWIWPFGVCTTVSLLVVMAYLKSFMSLFGICWALTSWRSFSVLFIN